jgi:branched-chain amino acid transport system permease protein
VFPFVSGQYLIYIANLCGIAVIGALGLNILSGYTGQISLGHAAFLAIGAYSSTLLTLKLEIPFWISLPLGGLITALFGLLIAIPCLRLRGFTWPLPLCFCLLRGVCHHPLEKPDQRNLRPHGSPSLP